MTASKKGILLVNLGSPDSPEPKDVKIYLREFLMDKRVIDVPYLLRKFIVECTILPSRPKESAHAYQTIWSKEGSPLIVLSQQLKDAVQEKVSVPVALGMRYGNPSIAAGINELMTKHPDLNEIQLIPLYPHYAMSSFETVVVKADEIMHKKYPHVNMEVTPAFYNDKAYINALADSMRPSLQEPYDHILFSYHGLPERHLRKSDPTRSHCLKNGSCCEQASEAHATCYRHQVYETTKAVAQTLQLDPNKYSVSFQSRLGKDPWIQPFTDFELERLPKEGVKRLLVVCPSFVSDCLETLEEIGIRGKEIFQEAGGDELQLIPCLNLNEAWVQRVADWCKDEVLEEVS